MWHRRKLIIRRFDHVGDPLGLVFLHSAARDGDLILERLREYLGNKVRIIRAEVSSEQIEVEVESRGWHEESLRLSEAARDLFSNGARRAATGLFREALDVDPLNAEAHSGLGMTLAAQEDYEAAAAAFTRAREAGASDSADLLLALSRCLTARGRIASAVQYLERALELEPKNFAARRALQTLRKTAHGPDGIRKRKHRK